jgi:F-type H+-transporting ATPase subunit epsilon
MAYSFRIDILTPEETYFSGDVVSVILPATAGSIGVLAHHAPLVTSLRVGKIELNLPSQVKKFFSIEGGFFEVISNQATLLVEKIVPLES